MSNGEKTVVTIVEPSAAVEEGEHTGKIKETEVKTYDAANGWMEVDSADQAEDPVQYFRVGIEVDGSDGFELSQSWSINNGQASPKTGLGMALERFGVDLQNIGEDVTLQDVFSRGTGVRFIVEQEESEDDEENGGFLEIQDESLVPIDEEVQNVEQTASTNGGSPSQNGDKQGEVYSVIGGMDNPTEGDVLKQLAQTDGSLVPEFKNMVEAGDVSVDADGNVNLA